MVVRQNQQTRPACTVVFDRGGATRNRRPGMEEDGDNRENCETNTTARRGGHDWDPVAICL